MKGAYKILAILTVLAVIIGLATGLLPGFGLFIRPREAIITAAAMASAYSAAIFTAYCWGGMR